MPGDGVAVTTRAHRPETIAKEPRPGGSPPVRDRPAFGSVESLVTRRAGVMPGGGQSEQNPYSLLGRRISHLCGVPVGTSRPIHALSHRPGPTKEEFDPCLQDSTIGSTSGIGRVASP